ncbi:MAG: polysaccharide biosynthesis protein [Bacilli bacterium]|nr:polysaccharide biosynthesis protein [Bacilli bacterium]
MKDVTMKKSNFVKGALITTFGIVIAKILGILYVIPFHAIIGDEGGALYGYAYTIYALFVSLASAGIPLAISKLVSEYQTMGYYRAKRRVFLLGRKIALITGFISFIIILVTAPLLAKAVLGNVVGGSTIKDVTFVIRVIGTAILIVPTLSIYRGYFEGHRLFSPPSISQVLEQITRVTIIILGSYMAIKVFKIDLTKAVGIALFGATLGAIISYIYLVDKRIKNRNVFNEKIRVVNEPKISNKTIYKKILYYAIPFIMIDIFKSLYNYVDMFTVVKGLVNYAQFEAKNAEVIYSMLSTWANKFNMIILAISTGVIVSLIPNLTESIVKKEHDKVEKKINQALGILLYLTVPMTLGISFLAKPIWLLFYGESMYGPSVLSYYIFVGLFIGLFTSLIIMIQILKDKKVLLISLVTGVIIKILLNNYLLKAFYNLDMPPYYGVITASIIGYLVSSIICLVVLKTKYKINFEEIVNNFINIMCSAFLMVLVLFICKLFIPITSTNRIMNLVIILIYTVIGAIVYFVFNHFSKLTNRVFGKDIFKILSKLFFRK